MVRKQKPIVLEATWHGIVICIAAAAIGLMVNQMREDPLPLVADWSEEAQLRLESGEHLGISLEGAEEAFFLQKAVFLDARPRELYKVGHIEGALSLPTENFQERFKEVLSGISLDVLLITYCDGEGCGQSHELALALRGKSYHNVKVLISGWEGWQGAHLPVEKGLHTPTMKE
jgi:rhodanese-related sulfurtransferase